MLFLEDFEEFKSVLNTSTQYLVFKFTATWCNPCKKVAPAYDSYATNDIYQNTDFYSIDVDEEDTMDIMYEYNLKTIPHFAIFKNKQLLDSKQTSNVDELLQFLNTHLPQKSVNNVPF